MPDDDKQQRVQEGVIRGQGVGPSNDKRKTGGVIRGEGNPPRRPTAPPPTKKGQK